MKVASERLTEENLARREHYLDRMSQADPSRILFVDETGINLLNGHGKYGWGGAQYVTRAIDVHASKQGRNFSVRRPHLASKHSAWQFSILSSMHSILPSDAVS